MVYTTEQQVFMLEAYFRNGRKVDGVWTYARQDCLEEFRTEFPEVIVDYNHFNATLDRCVKLFRETGSILRKEGSGRPKKRSQENIDHAREIMQANPKTPIRQLSQQMELSVGTCHTMLRKDLHFYPYRLTAVHQLLDVDPPQRLEFCEWFLNTLNNDDDTLMKTFFTDESWFYLSGYVNSQNMRTWDAENPHVFVERPLHPEKIGVWAAVSGRRLIGPIFFEGTLNALRYREEILRPFFEELHDDELQGGYFQQDGAAPHCTAETLALIREFFGDRIISRSTATKFPPRSCDLTACDYFLWPYIKNLIFSTPINNLEELKQRIRQKFDEINNNPNLLENVMNSMKRRVLKCHQEGGGHFKHLL